MNPNQQQKALASAISAAQAAGRLMRQNLRSSKKINSQTQHDIKLELDVRCQELIQTRLHKTFPAVAILGEEGILGDQEAAQRWVIDPIDGTVNFTYGIPHACVSIALQQRLEEPIPELSGTAGAKAKAPHPDAFYETLAGVVYDPFNDELWTAIRGRAARLNGRVICVSPRRKLSEAIVAMGFAKQKVTVDRMLPLLNGLIHRVRKVRVMGAAALAMTYVASGRFDAYIEYGLRLWDIAAGGLILECAGGEFWRRPIAGEHAFQIFANNGPMRPPLEKVISQGGGA
jgi:myo-inositol-1(or 4)-monophosphatase